MKGDRGSIFDTYSSVMNIPNTLSWEKVDPVFQIDKQEIVCEGQLQEMCPTDYQKQDIIYYCATVYKLYCYKVLCKFTINSRMKKERPVAH